MRKKQTKKRASKKQVSARDFARLVEEAETRLFRYMCRAFIAAGVSPSPGTIVGATAILQYQITTGDLSPWVRS